MEKKTIAQAVIEVLNDAKTSMTISEITQVILDRNLYSFNSKDPRAIVRGAIERRCQGVVRQDSFAEKFFEKLSDGKYVIK